MWTPSDELSHHGIQGMKWGDRNGPPYPLRPGARSGAEKKAGTPIADKFEDFERKRKRKAAIKKAQKTRKEKAKHERDRQEALRKGSAEDVLKFRGELSNDEMSKAVSRIEWENKLESLDRKQKETGYHASEKLFGSSGFFGRAKDYTGNIAGTLQNINKIKKALKDGDTGDKKKKNDGDNKNGNSAKHSAIIEHTGIKGQRWGSRRFRGYDGKLTPLGKQRYQKGLYTNYGYDSGSPPDGVYAYNKEEDEVYESVGGIMVAIDHDRPDYEEKKAEARRAMEMQEELKRAMSHTAYLGWGIYGVVSDETYLAHYGVKGMHWGIRRYQPYPDGKSGKFIGRKNCIILAI